MFDNDWQRNHHPVFLGDLVAQDIDSSLSSFFSLGSLLRIFGFALSLAFLLFKGLFKLGRWLFGSAASLANAHSQSKTS